jgi:hypothetical protein
MQFWKNRSTAQTSSPPFDPLSVDTQSPPATLVARAKPSVKLTHKGEAAHSHS